MKLQPGLVAALPGLVLLIGCGRSAQATHNRRDPVLGEAVRGSTPARNSERAEGVIVKLAAMPSVVKAGSPVQFNFTAYASHALGGFDYQIRYGDGTSAAESTVPFICVSGSGSPMRRGWHRKHSYRAPGRYRAVVSVYANCTHHHATATVVVVVGGP